MKGYAMERWQLTFIFSCIFSLFFVFIPAFFLLILGFLLCFGLMVKQKWVLSAIIFALCWFFIHAHWQTAWQLPPALIKKPIDIVGVVSAIPSTNGDNFKFNLQLLSIAGHQVSVFTRPQIKLNWQKANQPLRLGDTVRLTAKLKPAYGFTNLGGFSYQKWLLLNNIRATGYVVGQSVVIDKPSTNRRQIIFEKLSRQTQGLTYQGLLLALTMGEKQFIKTEQWQIIKATGISHLLAISGLHIGIVFLFALMLGKLLVKIYCLVLNQHLNAPLLALPLGWFGALIYAWLAGFSIPTVRALVMLSLLVLTLSLKRSTTSKTVILLTLTMLLIVQPLTILAPGLWLSFMAVIIIVMTFWWFPTVKPKASSTIHWYHRLWGYLQSMLKMQMALFVVMVPVTIVVFNGFSLISGPVNLIAVPWVSFVTVPLALMAACLSFFGWPTGLLFFLADQSLALLFAIIDRPDISAGWVVVKYMPWYGWLLLVVFGLSWLVSLPRPVRYCSLLLPITPLLLMFHYDHSRWQINILDVGQGLSVVIEKNAQAWVYDLGPIYKSGFNTAEHVVIPFLNYHGYQQIQTLMISHSDSDHAGDYQQFLAKVGVNQVIAPLKILPDANRCHAQTFDWQGLKAEVLWPIDKVTAPANNNDRSCVVRLSNKQFSVLIPGDISKTVEQQLVTRYGSQLNSTLLIAPHHGSNSSSSAAFIAAVDPQYVVYSSGFLNRYRFPRPQVVDRYQQANAQQFTTADSGQVSFVISDNRIEARQARRDMLPHWYFNK
jgi:competence protein ComEC